MTWLNDRQTELRKAEALKTGLDSQLQRHIKWLRAQEREVKRLSSRIHKYTKLRQEISRNLDNTKELRWDLESELEDAERAYNLNKELVERRNHMDPRKFPAEILEMIIELALGENYQIALGQNDQIELFDQSPNQLHLGIFGACKDLQKLAQKIFYEHATFKVSSAIINKRRYYDTNCWPEAPPRRLMQHLQLHIDNQTDIPKLLKLLGGCKALKSLVLIIESVPKNYARTLPSVRYQRPSKIDLIGVGILPGQERLEELQEARTMLLDVLWDTILPIDAMHINSSFIYYTRGKSTPLTLATIAGGSPPLTLH